MAPDRTLRSITKELIDTPVLPLLFLQEAIKIASLGGPDADIIRMLILGAVATILWVLSDAIDVDVDSDAIIGD